MKRLQKVFASLTVVGLVLCLLGAVFFNVAIPTSVTSSTHSWARDTTVAYFRRLLGAANFLEEDDIPYYTDAPRNQSTVNLSAQHWLDILPYRANATPSDAILMPITGANERAKKNATKTGFVYSAFLDPRFETGTFVRVLGVVHRKVEKLFCHFHWPVGDSQGVVEAQVELQWPPMKRTRKHQYWAVYVNCPLNVPKGLRNRDLLPTSVSIFPDKESWKAGDPGNNIFVHCGKYCGDPAVPDHPPALTFCQRQLFGNYSDVVQLVEFLEFHAILGFEHFYLYGHSYTKQVECVIQGYYRNESILDKPKVQVDFRNWEIPFRYPEDVTFFSPETPGNDCFFRSLLSGAEFVANADLDELFVPTNDFSAGPGALTELLRHLSKKNPKAGSFSFKRIQFPRQLPDDVLREHTSNLSDTDATGIQPRWIRKTMTAGDRLYPKLIHIPDRGTGVRTHWARKLLDGYEEIKVNPKSEGRCHHYRKGSVTKKLPNKLKDFDAARAKATDRTAQAYKELLTKRIEIFLKNVPEKCNMTAEVWNKDQP